MEATPVTFESFNRKAWADHGKDAQGVADRLPQLFELVCKPADAAPAARLIAHVMGEHLGEWNVGVSLLSELGQNAHCRSCPDATMSIQRTIAALDVASGRVKSTELAESLSEEDRVLVLSLAASMLSAHGEIHQASGLFAESIALISDLSPSSPVHRSLAVTGNNLACALEEKSKLTPDEEELMLLAARTARTEWEIAGGWLEVERAEYRLAMSSLKAGRVGEALDHGRKCLAIVEANGRPALEAFFAWEAIARAATEGSYEAAREEAVQKVRAEFAKLSDDDKGWCRPILEKLDL